jgi:hypothetical protein
MRLDFGCGILTLLKTTDGKLILDKYMILVILSILVTAATPVLGLLLLYRPVIFKVKQICGFLLKKSGVGS